MRFLTFLNENKTPESFDEIKELLYRDCKPFIDELKKTNRIDNLLLSGRKKSNKFFKGKVRKDRRPKDTPIEIHNYVDDWFEANWNIRPRSNSIFCTTRRGNAESYGNIYFIFPIGNYKIVYNPNINDLYGDEIQNREDMWYFVSDGEDDGLRDYLSWEWKSEYDEGKMGQYVYDNIETGTDNKSDAVDIVMDRLHPEWNEDPEKWYDTMMEVRSELEWQPEVDEEDFIERRVKKEREKAEKKCRRNIKWVCSN